MTFKPSVWFPIAAILSVINVVAVAFATTPPHTTAHAALGLAFGLWAQRLRSQMTGGGPTQARLEALEAEVNRLQSLEGDVGNLRQQLSEAAERLDFAERVLTQGREGRERL